MKVKLLFTWHCHIIHLLITHAVDFLLDMYVSLIEMDIMS